MRLQRSVGLTGWGRLLAGLRDLTEGAGYLSARGWGGIWQRPHG